jgi:hypothetical protein
MEQQPKQIPRCEICGEPCMMESGEFGLPIPNILTGAPITGTCCGICGPKLEEFITDDCRDLQKLPDGPLRGFLVRMRHLGAGLRCLDTLGWMAEHCATVVFRNTQLVAAGIADEVEVTGNIAGKAYTVTRPTLEAAIKAIMEQSKC